MSWAVRQVCYKFAYGRFKLMAVTHGDCDDIRCWIAHPDVSLAQQFDREGIHLGK
jgi:hypothetical protein